jgi:hypothetical protein
MGLQIAWREGKRREKKGELGRKDEKKEEKDEGDQMSLSHSQAKDCSVLGQKT